MRLNTVIEIQQSFLGFVRKKELLLVMLCWLATSFQAHATRSLDIDPLPFSKGWYAGTHIGTQYYFSDFKFRHAASIGYGFSSFFEGYVGKWLNPLVSVRASVDFGNVTGGYMEYDSNMEAEVGIREAFRMIHPAVDFIFDGGYWVKGRKTKYTCCPFFSFGYGINTTDDLHGVTYGIGCIQVWRFNEHLRFCLETKLKMMADELNGHTDRNDGQWVLNAGVAYAF